MAHDRTMLLSVRLEAIVMDPGAGGNEAPGCQQCGTELDFSQPDPHDPSRLIGACGGCGHWYLHEWPEGESEVLRLELPLLATRRMTLPLLSPPESERPPDLSYQAGA